MGNQKDFGIPRRAAQAESSDGYDFSASDSEPESDDETWASREYWLGKKYFEYTMAEQLFKRSHPDETVAELDSRLEASLRDFPYKEIGRLFEDLISAELCRDGDDDYEIFVTCLGAVVRKGSREEKKVIRDSLKRDGGEQHRAHIAHPAARSYEVINPARREVAPPGVASYRHKIALKEDGDRSGERPAYKTEEVDTLPPTYKATLHYKALEFSAVARSKKEAENTVAKEACYQFDIHVT